eukprot:4164712-Amphidinium_carterae.1
MKKNFRRLLGKFPAVRLDCVLAAVLPAAALHTKSASEKLHQLTHSQTTSRTAHAGSKSASRHVIASLLHAENRSGKQPTPGRHWGDLGFRGRRSGP